MKTALIFDCYDDYNIRIQYIKAAMERAGYAVHIFFSDFDHYSKQYVTKKRDGIEYLHAKGYQKNLSYARIQSHLQFARTCVKKAEEYNNISLIYVMVPPNSLCKEFAAYKQRHPAVKLIYDLCDMWPESLPVGNTAKVLGTPVFTVWRNDRNHYIGMADGVLSECNLFAEKIRKYVPEQKLHTVYLCQEYHENSSSSGNDQISFLYMGSMNNIMNIELIVKVLYEMNQKTKAVLHIVGDGEKKAELLQQVQQIGVKIIDHGVVYDETKKQEIYSQCQYGLNLMVDSVFIGLTMKSLDYMSHGLPLINNIKGDTWNFVENNQTGINIVNGKEKEAADKIVEVTKLHYNQYHENTIALFHTVFETNIIENQLDKILEDL
jgi:glycosyltransferase involved in cell wall biosynthesis